MTANRVGPLAGRQVVVCRRPDDGAALTRCLQQAGAGVRWLPVQAPGPAPDGGEALQRAVHAARSYAWLAVTSAAAVGPLAAAGFDPRAHPGLQVGAVGPATAAALADIGIESDVVPERATAADLAQAIVDHDRTTSGEGRTVLAPLAAGAGPDLSAGLSSAGYRVTRVDAYAMVPLVPDAAEVDQARRADAVVVAAPSVARRLAELGILNGSARIVAIGPRTAAALLALGARTPVEAAATDAEAVTAAVVTATAGTPLV